jgi:hypothetical protein
MVCTYSIKENICNRACLSGSELPEYMALILRNGGSQSPDRWLKEPRNNHYPEKVAATAFAVGLLGAAGYAVYQVGKKKELWK